MSREIRPGDRLRVLRNGVGAHVPGDWSKYLKPGDVFKTELGVCGNHVQYFMPDLSSCGSYVNSIPIEDVELVPEDEILVGDKIRLKQDSRFSSSIVKKGGILDVVEVDATSVMFALYDWKCWMCKKNVERYDEATQRERKAGS